MTAIAAFQNFNNLVSWQQIEDNHFLSDLFQSIIFSSLIMIVDSGNPIPILSLILIFEAPATPKSWLRPPATASYLSILRLLLPVPCPLHITRYLRILTEIFSDCGSGGLAREFGFIHHDAPPVEKEASNLSLQGQPKDVTG